MKGISMRIFPELVERNVPLIHRIPPDMQILPLGELKSSGQGIGETFMLHRPGYWDSEKIGAGAPPIKTVYGWLQIYHGVRIQDERRIYSLGVVLSDLNDPRRIIYRSPEPIIEPGGKDETEEERWYQLNGWVPNVTFTCGVVPRYKDSTEILDEEDELLVYYGVADEVICVAEAKVDDLIPKEIRQAPQKPHSQPPSCGRLRRFPGNPILKPRPEVEIEVNGGRVRWERLVYNAGAIRVGGITYILYRALGYDGISRIGLAWSGDGLHIDGRSDYPIFCPQMEYHELPKDEEERRRDHLKKYGMCREIGGCEDPRLTLIGDHIYMTYTAYGEIPQLALAKIKLKDFLGGVKGLGSSQEWMELWTKNGPIFYPLEDKDGVLFPE